MRGRKPKPTVLKQLAGNPGKRPLNKAEPQPPVPASTPYVPRHLCEEGKREWRRLVSILVDLGLYTEIDRAALAMYCQAWGRWVIAEERIDKTGGPTLTSDKGNLYPNPWASEANRRYEQMRKALVEFGLSPAQRSRVRAVERTEQLSLAEMLFGDVDDE